VCCAGVEFLVYVLKIELGRRKERRMESYLAEIHALYSFTS
jgi:hypothetical protein